MSNPLWKLKTLEQSVWLDDMRRSMLKNGKITRMIESDGLAGMTSNPAIFEKAIMQHNDYDEAITALARNGHTAPEIYEILTIEDVQHAADLFRQVYDGSNGRDGFVSLEVSPHLAYDTQQSIAEAKRLWTKLNRPNVMIKIPATRTGLPAITQLLAVGININVTLLFGITRYQEVVNAFIEGLQQRAEQNKPLDHISSVASFFLSRIDVLVDKQLDKLAQNDACETAYALRGQTAVACARLAYQYYQDWITTSRWQNLASKGARPQRLLWASTGTKDPSYSDTKYVDALVAKETVNTMPLQTLAAYRDHGHPTLSIEQELDAARALPEQLNKLGISLDLVSDQLEKEGVQKFIEPYDQLLESLERRRAEIV